MHNEHISTMNGPAPVWHVQDIRVGDAALTAEYGLAPGVGLSLTTFYRQVSTRIRFEDEGRAPIVLADGDIHHRNETLTGPGDPWAMVVVGKGRGPWSLAFRGGISVPLGRTEDNPFELGHHGLPHQHIQFGTGTWDPLAGISVSRQLGATTVAAHVLARFVAYENGHGYRAGNRYGGSLVADRRIGPGWRVYGGLDLSHENAERWSGVIEEEGNLGRTDLLAGAGLARQLGSAGALTLQARVPVFTHAHGAQVDYPVLLSVGLSR